MNLKSFVDSLTEKEKAELMELLDGDKKSIAFQSEPTEEDFLNKNNPEFTMNKETSNKVRRSVVKAGNNTWSDEGEDRHIETPPTKITPRNRRPPQKKTVTCSSCGKKYNINSSLVYGEYYRCEKCTG